VARVKRVAGGLVEQAKELGSSAVQAVADVIPGSSGSSSSGS
jgi:hypothetical protein